jgi:hypothetical protein
MDFDSLTEQLSSPSLMMVDFSKMEAPQQILSGFKALWAFEAKVD